MGYVHIFDIMQPVFLNGMCPGKSLKTSLLSPGNPVPILFPHYYFLACLLIYLYSFNHIFHYDFKFFLVLL